eukprot:c6522_g1_i1.p1 GENE.c6522_g1_i1~~c6522_g1_i1.p1  ORF type:complete len:336 (+),score=70.80 c6522_g1_i1:93-1100(+)
MVTVSIITPMRNASRFLTSTIDSVIQAAIEASEDIEWVVFDDASEDDSVNLFQNRKSELKQCQVNLILLQSTEPARGCGFGRNRCVEASKGDFLCFLDADDMMMPRRIKAQLELAQVHPTAIIGSNFSRDPPNSTVRFARWLNGLTEVQLKNQRFREVTIAMPTWFMHRSVFQQQNGFNEGPPGTPEDLIFFYGHTARGGDIVKCNEELMIYRYHEGGQHLSVPADVILEIRAKALEREVLSGWDTFMIWGANKEGKKLYKALSTEARRKVTHFLDVSVRKIGGTITTDNIPVIHFSQARPPVITAVKLDLTGGGFEKNLESMGWTEGIDYYHFG